MLCKGRECPWGERLRAQEGECHSLKTSGEPLSPDNQQRKTEGTGTETPRRKAELWPQSPASQEKRLPVHILCLFVCLFFRTNYYVTEDDFGLLNPLPPPVEITGICHYT